MSLHNTTPTPNTIFDTWLPTLTVSELKVLLVIIRQTYGWIDVRNGGRKTRDRINIGYFRNKTGLSRKSISLAIDSLIVKGLITACSASGELLSSPASRKGKWRIYYTCCLQQVPKATKTSVEKHAQPVTNLHITKETHTKETGISKDRKTEITPLTRLSDKERYKQILQQSKFRRLA